MPFEVRRATFCEEKGWKSWIWALRGLVRVWEVWEAGERSERMVRRPWPVLRKIEEEEVVGRRLAILPKLRSNWAGIVERGVKSLSNFVNCWRSQS